MVRYEIDGREVSKAESLKARGIKDSLSEEGKRRVASASTRPKPLTAFGRTDVTVLGPTPPEKAKAMAQLTRENLEKKFARANLRGDIFKNRFGKYEARTETGQTIANQINAYNKTIAVDKIESPRTDVFFDEYRKSVGVSRDDFVIREVSREKDRVGVEDAERKQSYYVEKIPFDISRGETAKYEQQLNFIKNLEDTPQFEKSTIKTTSQINADTLKLKDKIRNKVKNLSSKVKQRLLETILNPEAVADTNKTIVKLLKLDKAEALFLKQVAKREGRTNLISLTFGKKVGTFSDDVSKQLVKLTLNEPIQDVTLLLGGIIFSKTVKVGGRIIKFVAKTNPRLATILRLGGKASGVVILGAYANGVVKEAQKELKETGKVTKTTAKAIRDITLIGLGARFGAKGKVKSFKQSKSVKNINKKVNNAFNKLDKSITRYADNPSSQRKILGVRGKTGALRGGKGRRLSKAELRKRTTFRDSGQLTRQQRKDVKLSKLPQIKLKKDIFKPGRFVEVKKAPKPRFKESSKGIFKPQPKELLKPIPKQKEFVFLKGKKGKKGKVIAKITEEKFLIRAFKSGKEAFIEFEFPKKGGKLLFKPEPKILRQKPGRGFTAEGTGKLKPSTTSQGQVLVLKEKPPLLSQKKVSKLATEKELFNQYKTLSKRKGDDLLPSRFKTPSKKQIPFIDVAQEPSHAQIPGVRGVKTGGREVLRQEILQRLRVSVLQKEKAIKFTKNKSIKAKLKREVATLKLEAKRLQDIRTQARRQALILPGQIQTLKLVSKASLKDVLVAKATLKATALAIDTRQDVDTLQKLDTIYKRPGKPPKKPPRKPPFKFIPVKPPFIYTPKPPIKPPRKPPIKPPRKPPIKPPSFIFIPKPKKIIKFKLKKYKPSSTQYLRFSPTIVRPKKIDRRLRLYTGAELR